MVTNVLFISVVICITTQLEFAHIWYAAFNAGFMNGDFAFLTINLTLPGYVCSDFNTKDFV